MAHKATLRERYRHVLRVRARRRLAPRRPEGMCAQRHDPLAVAKEHHASVRERITNVMDNTIRHHSGTR